MKKLKVTTLTLAEVKGCTADCFALLNDNWLRKKQTVLLSAAIAAPVGPLALQLGLAFSVGKPLFGFKPARPLRVGIALRSWIDQQALYQFKLDVTKTLTQTEGWTAEELTQALGSLEILRIDASCTGKNFSQRLQQLQRRKQYDLILVTSFAEYYAGALEDSTALKQFLLAELRQVSEDPQNPCAVWYFNTTEEAQKTQINDNSLRLGAGTDVFKHWADRLLFLKREKGAYYILKAVYADSRLQWFTPTKERTNCSALVYDKQLRCWRETSPEDGRCALFQTKRSRDSYGNEITVVGLQDQTRCNILTKTKEG